MADGRFLRAHSLNLYHLQYECLGLLSIGVPSLSIHSMSLLWIVCNAKLAYLWEPLDCCGTKADGRILRGNGLNLYYLKYECLGQLSIRVTPLYVSVCLCYLPLPFSHRANKRVGRVGVHFFSIFTIYTIYTTVRYFLKPRETMAYNQFLRTIALIWIP